ncbi:MAG TPA: radical SAM protein [Herpetosiphonaceae bacterium]
MDHRLRVLLFQLPVPNNPTLNVPLALGYLKAYAHAQGLLDHAAIEILPRSLADHAGDALLVAEIVARQPEVLGISLYTWNSERSLDIARRVKEQLPSLQVVVGGPEVQRDNLWVLHHPAVDVAVIGEGEQTFADLLRFWCGSRLSAQPDTLLLDSAPSADPLAQIPGLAYRWEGELRFTAERVALNDLSVLPSPYLLGYLETPPDSMLMVEISRWCPYACSFCLYGRNMGTKLGNRYFSLERVLQEIAWGRERGITRVHFIEANLNLVPLFWPLMRALEVINADQQMTFYAELRGEHLTEEVVAALDRCNVRYVEVGLQTANLVALRASHRRTDLQKWAAGTRRLYSHNIEVYLDVILGLPEDNSAGVAETLDFIQRESLGPYDIFTLQVLPGTAVRQQAAQYDLRFQERPPYYVLHTDQFSYQDLRRLRRQLKLSVDLPPDAIEGMPLPRPDALISNSTSSLAAAPIERVRLAARRDDSALSAAGARLSRHVDLVLDQADLAAVKPLLAGWIVQNPATIFDLYLLCADDAPDPAALGEWRDALPYQPGYLDRVAVYLDQAPDNGHRRVSPRCWLVLPWTSTVDPDSYRELAEVIWRFDLEAGEQVPFGAWYAAGGAGIWLHFAADTGWEERVGIVAQIREWERETGRSVWLAAALPEQHATLV